MYKSIKSFVLRGGRITNKQQHALDNSLNKYLLPDINENWIYSDYFNNDNQTIVEIGFGMGDALIENAIQNPHLNFIGIEVFKPGIGNLLIHIEENKLNNIRIAPYDAVDIFNYNIQTNSLLGIQIFFPDPWHKKKHHKRRLIQEKFVANIKSKLGHDGFIHVATDWEDYALQIDEVFSKEPMLYHIDSKNMQIFNRPLTKFEQRGIRLGHKIWDFVYCSR